MLFESRPVLLCCAALAAQACSGRVEAPDNAGPGLGGSPTAPRPPTAGSSGVPLAGARFASGGSGGHREAPGELAAGGADVEVTADAELAPTDGNAVTGSARFVQHGQRVELSLSLSSCPEGPHALHLHVNAACGDNARAAGGHWSAQGDGLGEVTCMADGSAQYTYTPPDGTWSLGGPASTNLLGRALVLHAGPNLPEPGARIACGIPVKVE